MSVARWIIPAYAGSTTSPAQRLRAETNHPRIRGEHGVAGRLGTRGGGSSPHTRGALRSLSVSPGGHGSSPHTRGAPSPVSRQPTIRRIIPAYAGSTAAPPRRRAMKPDHPRIRGEHRSGGRRQTGFLGSSPHTRGAQRRFEWLHTLWGIIPAYAGSTLRSSPRLKLLRDHPRIRGEHDGNRPASQEREGSSPHTRGAPTHPRHPRHNQRIIPAYAGSTHRLGCAGDFGRDHPRIRGEHHD